MIINDCVLDLENSMDLEPAATPWYDLSRYHTNGVVTGATWAQLPSGLWVKDFNSATPDYVVVTCPQLNFTTEDFSGIFRIYIDNLVASRCILERGAITADGYTFVVAANGIIYLYTSQAAAEQHTISNVLSIGATTWYTLGWTRAGNSVRLYRDGVDVTFTPAVHVNPATSARTAKIGVRDNLTTQPFDGKIGFQRIFNYALTPGEHRNWHNKISYLYGAV